MQQGRRTAKGYSGATFIDILIMKESDTTIQLRQSFITTVKRTE